MRVGLIARKVGMSSLFNENGKRFPITILEVSECEVVDHRQKEKHGYSSLVIGAESLKKSRATKPMREFFNKKGIEPKVKLKEFRISEDSYLEIGHKLTVEHFILGQCVDIVGTSIGKGFAGSMKRHNFRGMEASHGVSITHRAHGSTGGRQDPGKVFKNKKMAGHMGARKVTVQNLPIVIIDRQKQILAVKGNIPGAKNSFVYIRDAIKKR